MSPSRPPTDGQVEEFRARMLRAATTRAQIAHPNLLATRVTQDEDGEPQLEIEACRSPRLRETLARGPLGLRASAKLISDVAAATQALAGHGLIARELTPDRIFLDRTRGAVLADLGVPPDVVPIGSDEPAAERVYRSPEERAGDGLDARSTVYSLAALYIAAATGKRPPEQFEPRSENGHSAVPKLERVVGKAMAPDPEDRYADPGEFLTALVDGLRDFERQTRSHTVPADTDIKHLSNGATRALPTEMTTASLAEAEELERREAEAEAARRAEEAERREAEVTRRLEKQAAKEADARRRVDEKARKKAEADARKQAEAEAKEREELERREAEAVKRAEVEAILEAEALQRAQAKEAKAAETRARKQAKVDERAAAKVAKEEEKRRRAETQATARAEAKARKQAQAEERAAAKAAKDAEAARHAEEKAAKEDADRRAREAQATRRAEAKAKRAAAARAAEEADASKRAEAEQAKRARAEQDAERKADVPARTSRPSRRSRRGEEPAPKAPVGAAPSHTAEGPARSRTGSKDSAAGASRTSRRLLIAAALVVGTVAGIAVAMSARDGDGSTELTSDALSLRPPAGWHETNATRGGFGPLSDALAASAGGGAGMVAGLPRDVRAAERALDDALPGHEPRAAVQLGPLQAWRYDGVRPRRGSVGVAYLSYTTGGPLLIVCHASPRNASRRLSQCGRAAQTVEVKGERPIALAAVERSNRSLRRALAALGEARVAGRERFADAPIASEQAAIAESLDDSFRDASRRVERIDTPAAQVSLTGLVAALTKTGAAYGDLAAATAKGNATRYDAARRAVIKTEARLRDEILRVAPR